MLPLLSSSAPQVSALAISALAGLAATHECAAAIVESGSINKIVSIMAGTEDINIKIHAVSIFTQVAQHDALRPLLATPTLLHLLIDALFAAGTPLPSLASRALALLSTEDASAAKNVFTLGGLQGLVPLLSAAQDATTRVAAATAISNMARLYPPSRASILHSEDGAGLGLILAILAAPANAAAEAQSVRNLILELLEMISVEAGFAKLLDSLGGLPGLVSQLDPKASQNKSHTHLIKLLTVLANVSRDSNVCISNSVRLLLISLGRPEVRC